MCKLCIHIQLIDTLLIDIGNGKNWAYSQHICIVCILLHAFVYSSSMCILSLYTTYCVLLLSDYQPVLALIGFTANFSKRLSTFTYSYQESCSLYLRCTSYFSVEFTVSPHTVVTNTSSGCTVEYTISNLERCRTYHSTATVLLDNQRGNTIVVGDTVMLSE